jgi:hypothetical protein
MTATVRAPSAHRTVARPGRPGRRLGRNAHRALLTAHVLSAVGWFGIAVAVAGGLVLTARTDDAVLGDALVDVLRTSLWLSVPAGLLTAATGVALSLTTTWGLVRYRWVIAKELVTVAVVVTDLTVVRAGLGAMADGGSWTEIVFPVTAHCLMLALATGLSVFKPGRPRGRRAAAALAGAA